MEPDGRELKGGLIAYVPLGVLQSIDIKYRSDVEISMKPTNNWDISGFNLTFNDVNKLKITLKHIMEFYEEGGSGPKPLKDIIADAIEKGRVRLLTVLNLVFS